MLWPGTARSEYKNAKRLFRAEYRRSEAEYEKKEEAHLRDDQHIDQKYFWHLVRKARKGSKKKICPIRNDAGELVTQTGEICEAWAEHYEALATPKDNSEYDEKFRHSTEQVVRNIEQEKIIWGNGLYKVPFSRDEVKKALSLMKKNKAGGWDGITVEHLLYGGEKCVKFLTKLCNLLVKRKYVPEHFKKGIKIPLYKGGGKDSTCRDNHRGITLLPVISKFYETLLLQRVKPWFEKVVNKRQGAAQRHSSSLHTSLVLQEAITHLTEGGSTAYVCLLDTKQAFDCVWINGLFAQLYRRGIDYDLWWILKAYYDNFKCTVRINNELSRWFHIKQGVHQGGVLSPKLYQVFIDSLFEMLDSEGVQYLMYGKLICHDVAYADDVALVSIGPSNLQHNMDVTYRHSRMWRYDHHAKKSVILRFGKHKGTEVKFVLGENEVHVAKSAKHVGVVLGDDKECVEEKLLKGRRATAAMQSLAKSGTILNPAVASKIYWSVTVPTMLYGIEVWGISDSSLGKFEVAHRQMAKNVQGLPSNVAGVGCLAPLGWVMIESWVDRRRLLFLWNVLNLPGDNICRQCCVYRLNEIWSWSKMCSPAGPVYILYETCRKYGLESELWEMVRTGVQMTKNEWKTQCSTRIMEREQELWWCSIHLFNSLSVYREVFTGVKRCQWWDIANTFPQLREQCRSVVIVLLGGCVWWNREDAEENMCVLCKHEKDSPEHFLFSCSSLNRERLDLLHEVSVYLRGHVFTDNLTDREKVMWALSTNEEELECKCEMARHIDKMYRAKMELCKAAQ